MTLAILFWFLMICWLIFGFWGETPNQPYPYVRFGRSLLLWVLLGILGWAVFGAAIHR